MVGNAISTKSNSMKARTIPEELKHKPVSSGPWGGDGGLSWDDGLNTGIRQIVLRYGNAIDSITIEYDKEGISSWSPRHGGSGGRTTHKIVFDYPTEILMGISGCYGSFYSKGPLAIRSLTFHTNLRNHGPYGVEEGKYFESSIVGSRIAGFHGRSGSFLDAIGVYTQLYVKCNNDCCDASKMVATVISSVKDIVDAIKLPPPDLSGALSREVSKVRDWKPVPSMTWGGGGGNPWDDGIYSGIRQIVLRCGDAIDCITAEYASKGGFVWGIRHGGPGGRKVHTIKFDYPDEYLTSISGYYGHFAHMKPIAVRSLTFHTNKAKYGPYGAEKGTKFSSPESGRKILGLCGRSGWYLDAIGVHLVAEQQVTSEESKEEVERAWKEFVSRVVHHKVLVESKAGV